jgi:DNA-binding beta-propeller fold protein YncE
LILTVSAADSFSANVVDRSPVDLVIGPEGRWLVTANQTSHTASLVRTSDGAVLGEVPVGRRPTVMALCPDGRRVLISGSESGTVTILEVEAERLVKLASIFVGFRPHGIAVAGDGRTAYVALAAADEVAVLDLESHAERGRIQVGRWPRYLALSPDGTRLAVGTSGDRGMSVVDTASRTLLYIERFVGLNIGHVQISSDGQFA